MNKCKSVIWFGFIALNLLILLAGPIQDRALAQSGPYHSYSPIAINYQPPLPSNSISVLSVSPSSPAELALFDKVTVTFEYTTDEASGVRIWAIPYTNGERSPGHGYQPSIVLPTGQGSLSRWFFITSGTVTVDEILLLMNSADGTRTLYEEFIPVEYHVGG